MDTSIYARVLNVSLAWLRKVTSRPDFLSPLSNDADLLSRLTITTVHFKLWLMPDATHHASRSCHKRMVIARPILDVHPDVLANYLTS